MRMCITDNYKNILIYMCVPAKNVIFVDNNIACCIKSGPACRGGSRISERWGGGSMHHRSTRKKEKEKGGQEGVQIWAQC